MGIVVTLADYTPPPRADTRSWTKVRIEEAAATTGPWVVIDTQNTGPDAEPAYPTTRDLTTRNGTIAEGFYRVVWVDGEGGTSAPSEVVQNLSLLSGGVRPTIAEVAALIRSRTKIVGGKEVGTFNESTRPTQGEVDALIDDAVDEVLGKVKPPTETGAYERRVRAAVALYTAILIELSYFPEQVGTNKSPLTSYEKLYERRIKSLIAESETGEVGSGEAKGDEPRDPVWGFPSAAPGGLIGWESRF